MFRLEFSVASLVFVAMLMIWGLRFELDENGITFGIILLCVSSCLLESNLIVKLIAYMG